MLTLPSLLFGLIGFILLIGFTVFGMTVEQWPFENGKPREWMQVILMLLGFGVVSLLLLATMFIPTMILLHLKAPYVVSTGIGLPLGFLSLLFGGNFLLDRLSKS